MKRMIRIVFLFCMMSMMSCSKTSSVIPHDDMSHIYADMLMRDQWIISNFPYREKADTTFVYGSILEKYGYSRDEFNEATDFYVDHPDVLDKILQKTISLLEGRKLVVENLIRQKEIYEADSLAQVKRLAYRDSLIASVPKKAWKWADSLYVPEVSRYRYAPVWSAQEMLRKSFVRDSIEVDSIRIIRTRTDSIRYEGLMVDSLRVDSLKHVLMKEDSLRVDSLRNLLRKRLILRTDYDRLKVDSTVVNGLERFRQDSLRLDSLMRAVKDDSLCLVVEDGLPVLRTRKQLRESTEADTLKNQR